MKRKVTLWAEISFAFACFTALLFIVPTKTGLVQNDNLLVVSTLLFAILSGFYIAATLTNYSKLQELVAEETGTLIALSQTIQSAIPKLSRELNDKIDAYLITSFDYELMDSVEDTWQEFNNILRVTDKIRKKDTNIYAHILELRRSLTRMRQEFDLTARRIMSSLDWLVMLTLTILTSSSST